VDQLVKETIQNDETKEPFVPAVLHGSGAARNAPYSRWNSGGAFEIGTANFGHPIEYADANLGFGFLIFERGALSLGPITVFQRLTRVSARLR
jgi:hypothetical protein